MKRINNILVCFVFMSISQLVFSQGESKDVSIIVTGIGKTIEEAKQVSLRNAIEQAYGTFISAKTEVLNDQVLSDEITSITSGNIKTYEILSQDQLPNGLWSTTLKTFVSVDKLTSFVQSKGLSVEIKGGLFALNIKQQILNEQGEIRAVRDMVGLLHEPMQISFDYVIKSSDPKSLDAESKNWEISLMVIANCNKNIDFCANYCIKTLETLSLSSDEVASYKSLNKDVFTVCINYNRVTKTFYLRNRSSLIALNTFVSQWEFYTRLFTVHSGMDELNANGQCTIHSFGDPNHRYNSGSPILCSPVTKINFLTSGQQAATFSWSDKRTLSQIEQMNGYTVKPMGVVSSFKYGGFVLFEENGHGLVASITDLEKMNWESAKTACDELTLNGYSDWHLPSKEELNSVYVKKKHVGVYFFRIKIYWSSSEFSNWQGLRYGAYNCDANFSYSPDNKAFYYFVRAVRDF